MANDRPSVPAAESEALLDHDETEAGTPFTCPHCHAPLVLSEKALEEAAHEVAAFDICGFKEVVCKIEHHASVIWCRLFMA
ncbi:MAG: hypothetical protein ABSD21_00805 [Rhizomicrobium sp.]|jgi:hypothetical protein